MKGGRLPVVAFVGRPNVGKSSLFNRFLGERVAIVDETPGITRDRIVREADIEDYRVLLVDTGGVGLKESEFAKEVREQAERAMESADVIVFVTSVQEGVTPLDREVADILRKQNKPVIVAVNKVDEPFMEDGVYEFYSLGFDDVIPVSAIHKIGIPALKGKIIEKIPEELKETARARWLEEERERKVDAIVREKDPERLKELVEEIKKEEESDHSPIKVAIVGRPNTGKSTLLNALTGEKRAIVSPIPGTTRDAIDTHVVINDRDFVFIDTAGIRRRGKIKDVEYYSYLRSLSAIERADVALLLIDAKEGATERDAKVAGLVLERFKPLIIVVNKVDLLSESSLKDLENALDLVFDFASFAPRVFISALRGTGLENLVAQTLELYGQYSKRVNTGRFNRVLEEILKVHQPPVYRNKPVKIYYGTQIKTKPPTFLLFANYPEGITSSFSRFLENRLRKELQMEKIPIRLIFKKR